MAKRKDPLFMRINREPALYELARAVSYGGVRAGDLRDKMAELSAKYGSHAVAMAFTELTMTDPATSLTVLRPEARKACGQILGPAPESPEYEEYYRANKRTPPAEHKPPSPESAVVAAPEDEAAIDDDPVASTPASDPAPPVQQSAAQVTTPRAKWRYEPSDDALAAFERLEEWLRGADGRPVDAAAEDTLRVLALALLQGKKGWFGAAESRLLAMQQDPPSYVPDGDSKAFDGAMEDLLDRLHEVMLTPGMGR